MNEDSLETRQERREQKLRKKRERIPKHGKNLARVYMDAIIKQLRRGRDKPPKSSEKQQTNTKRG